MKAKWKGILIGSGILLCSIFCIIFWQNSHKNLESGNTNTIQTETDWEQYLLTIRSYKAEMTVSIQSNKTQNQYKMTQEYQKDGIQKMVIQEPENNKGLEIEAQGETITVRHTKLGLSQLYQQQEELTGNQLWLSTFLANYAQDPQRKITQTETECIFTTTIQPSHPYYQIAEVHFDKNTKKPTQMLVQDKDKKNRIYIVYNEIEIYS